MNENNCYQCKHFRKMSFGGFCWWQARQQREADRMDERRIEMMKGQCRVFEAKEAGGKHESS